MKKPIVGIVSSLEMVNRGNYEKPIFGANQDYIEMIKKFGGMPIIIPYCLEIEELYSLLNVTDALLLIGGEDISSFYYKHNKCVPELRDDFEIKMYEYFKNENKPILGICRGLQLINVAEGGSLTEVEKSDLNHFIESDGWINYHNIKIGKDTKLYKIIKSEEYTTSSVHHQKIDKLGKDLIASASSLDGVIEVIEHKYKNFIVAFQGHIEKCLNNYSKYENVIKKFIEEAQK